MDVTEHECPLFHSPLNPPRLAIPVSADYVITAPANYVEPWLRCRKDCGSATGLIQSVIVFFFLDFSPIKLRLDPEIEVIQVKLGNDVASGTVFRLWTVSEDMDRNLESLKSSSLIASGNVCCRRSLEIGVIMERIPSTDPKVRIWQ
ncbi:hypothetical protein R1flu_017594 [Riccia fluitans]|uniref:Uncharacterized protein n=1 Tax=Riccia fluitans TaxID=41844 RepID=A0ABD1ZEQ9_9MARC